MFSRRHRQAAPPPPGVLSGQGVNVSLTPYPIPPRPAPGQLGVAGWAPLPGYLSPPQQIGAFAGSMLNQYPARIDGPQLHSGREWGNSHWYYPMAVPAMTNLQQTTRPNNVNGGQRYGSRFSGFIGPITAQRNASQVALAQIRQSGLSALGWAAKLNPANQ